MTEDFVVRPGWSEQQGDCRRLFDDNPLPLWVFEPRGILDVNQAAVVQYGYSRAEFLALKPQDLGAPEPSPTGAGESASKNGDRRKHHRKDGSVVDVEVTSFAINFGPVRAVLVSALDVTYRLRTEAQARYLDFLLATVSDAVVASDEEFILTGWNAAAESTYGRRAAEVLGQPDGLVFGTDFVGVERADAIKKLVETGRFHGELTHRRGDGKRIHIESRAAALFDSTGRRIGYVSVNRDVTDRRYAEETIRSLLSEVITAQEEERRRIARELHDETAQALTSLLVGLRNVEQSPDLARAQRAAATLRTLVADTLEGVQRIARGLHPSALDDLGLADALERLAAEFARANTFLVDLHMTGPRRPRLPAPLELALYRVTQEALTNSAKHASPKAVSILIHRNATSVRLVVEDDGVGFDVAQAETGRRLGLVGMRERAHLVGGSITVESSLGGGTTVCVTVPLAASTLTPEPAASGAS